MKIIQANDNSVSLVRINKLHLLKEESALLFHISETCLFKFFSFSSLQKIVLVYLGFFKVYFSPDLGLHVIFGFYYRELGKL